jgi:Plasmid pRiA4b ORF-3-like protein
MPRPTTTQTVHQLDVTLNDIEPRIWRRIEVPSSITLAALHDVIQRAMGWQGYHLHQFEIGDTVYGVDDGEGWGPDAVDENRARLADVAPEGTVFTYEYDFGDSWQHSIKVVQVAAPATTSYPRCVAGERACPPEDCGGAWAYAELVEALADPRHEQHGELLEWVGDSFDPAEFDLAQVNARLART